MIGFPKLGLLHILVRTVGFLICLFVLEIVLLFSSGWQVTHYVKETGLNSWRYFIPGAGSLGLG